MNSLSDTLDTLNTPSVRAHRKTVPASVAVARFDEQFPVSGADRRGRATPEQAWTTGYDVGFEQGMACGRAATEADAAAADRRATLVASAVAGAAENAAFDLEAQCHRATETVLATAFEVAYAIIGRDLRERPRTGEEALRTALELVANHEPCIAHLHPSDLELLGGKSADAIADLVGGRADFRIVADPSVDSGDCVIETDSARIEHRLSDALARVRQTLDGSDLAAPAETTEATATTEASTPGDTL